ncbi:MAG TPA: LLM class flavin-dependent oxidoreductase [Solirubrobacteraceae bacterium]|nr:LLM class flavin-dependent oxidoreductase [Solirubrobacteraceae bacterium]
MIRLGINLPTFDPLRVGGRPRFIEAARISEDCGFDAVWVGDHLHVPSPVYDSTVALAAVAATTSRIELGFGVMLLGLRRPAWVAKQLTTIDALAPGRLLLGVGVGGEFPAEFEALGLNVRQRGRLLDQALAELPDWLQGRSTPALSPTIGELPPIWVGGRSDAALARAARVGDGWLGTWASPERIAAVADTLAGLAATHDRPQPRIGLAISVHIDANEGRAREEAEDYTRAMYGMPFERVAKYTPVGSAERIAEQLSAYATAGVEEFVLTPLTGDPLGQIPRLAEIREIVSRQ